MAARKPRGPDASKLTEEALREAALSHLDRYDASVEQLRRVLSRRVVRYAEPGTEDDAKERIEELLRRFEASQLIDDDRFARGFTRSQRERGASALKVRQKLRSRGVAPETVDAALSHLENEGADDLEAARAYARKRRLTQRYDLTDRKQREKALAALARQGFSLSIALEVLSADEE